MQIKPLCACGCGDRITSKKKGARFLTGHNGRDADTWRGIKRGWKNQADPIWDGDCLRWQGTHSQGYGTYDRLRIHRVVWELFNGPIAPGMTIDHVYDWGCRHRDCFRLSHMEVVTQSENTRRNQRNRENRAKTHCPQGHPYDDKNTYFNGISRKCKTCTYARQRKYEAERRRARGIPPRNFTKKMAS